jgi:acyl-coenzyme A thioesterase PaaI-like protein
VCGVENPIGLHLKFYETGPGEVTADLNLPEIYQGYPGIVHGGVIAAMLDEAAGRAHMGPVEAPRFMFTAKLDVRYRKNVPVGQPLLLVGKAGPTKSRTAEGHSAIYDRNGTLLADADILLVNVPEKMIQSTDLDVLGWKIYPDEEKIP